MALNNAAAAFIGAAVTLVLVIIFMILMVILVRQCLAFLAKRSAVRAQMATQQQARVELERQRRGSVTEPVPATFDWHHSIRIAGTPPPTYHEAKELPAFDESIIADVRRKKDSGGEGERGEGECSDTESAASAEGNVADRGSGDNETMNGNIRHLTDVAHQREVHVSILVDDDVDTTFGMEIGVEGNVTTESVPSTVDREEEGISVQIETEQ